MTKAGEKIIEGVTETLALAQGARSYSHDINIGLFKAALPGSGFYITEEGLAELDWQDAMRAVRDNENATGVSLTFKNGGVHVRML